MVEHVSIADADRHEVKHASTGVLNQALLSNGNGTTKFGFVSYADLANKPTVVGYRPVVSGFSTVASQAPSVVDTPLQVEFGAGTTTTDVTLASSGLVTLNTPGDYIVTLSLGVGRTSGAGIAILLYRLLVNGAQISPSGVIRLGDQDVIVPFSTSINVQTTTGGSTLQLQIMRDSAGINQGGLYRAVPTATSWNIAPNASITISKYRGVL